MNPTLVDFHVHGEGSRYKDSFATASYDQICAYFDKIARRNKTTFTVAVTDHDLSVLTFEKFKELQKKYPNVRLVLGMESNCKLGGATQGVFESAHILTYADMSSDESIKKWIECPELVDISKIKAFKVNYIVPSNYKMAVKFCHVLNSQFDATLNAEEIAKIFEDTYYDSQEFREKLFDAIAEKLILNAPKVFAECKTKDEIKAKLEILNFRAARDKNFSLMGLTPSFYNNANNDENVKAALRMFNAVTGSNISFEHLKNYVNLNARKVQQIDSDFVEFVLPYLAKNNAICKELGFVEDNYGKRCQLLRTAIFHQNYAIKSTNSKRFLENERRKENFGEALYIAKSVLNKHLGLNITNHEVAEILNPAKSRKLMREEFFKFVKICLSYKNKEVYEKVKDMNLEQFSSFKLGTNKHGDFSLSRLVPLKIGQGYITDKDDVRTPLAEIDAIVKKTNGHLLLAHPNTKFKFTEDFKIPMNLFKDITDRVVSKAKFKDIKDKCIKDGGINTDELKDRNSQILMIDLFFKLCKQKGINFEGFEITREDFQNKKLLMNKLIYASKNGYEISFGSDTHLSSLHYYNELFAEHKISKQVLDERLEQAKKINDTTHKGGAFKKPYILKFSTNQRVYSNAKKIAEPIIKNHSQVNPHKEKYLVTKTSFCDKLLGEYVIEEYKPMLEFSINGHLYSFEANELKKLNYNFSDDGERKEEKSFEK